MRFYHQKKTLWVILATLIVTGITIGCSIKYDPNNHEVEEEAEILNSLETYNAQLATTMPTRCDNCGEEKPKTEMTMEDCLDIASEDVLKAASGALLGGKFFGGWGAVVGGVVVGAAGSWLEYRRIEQTNQEANKPKAPSLNPTILQQEIFEKGYVLSKDMMTNTDYQLAHDTGLDSCYVRVGILHNYILDNLAVVMHSDSDHLLNELSAQEIALLDHEEFRANYIEILEGRSGSLAGFSGYATQIMQLFLKGIRNSCDTQEKVNSFIGYYTAAVKRASSLSDVERDALLSGFAVMSYSWKHWTDLSKEEEEEHEVL